MTRAYPGQDRLVLTEPIRETGGVKLERARENVFEVTATGQELSALIAGARLALDVMRSSPEPPAAAIELLERVLRDFDRARERLSQAENGGRPSGPAT
jgi:hypothetical protein